MSYGNYFLLDRAQNEAETDAIMATLPKLDEEDRLAIERQVIKLITQIDRMGVKGALELLGRLGMAMVNGKVTLRIGGER